MKILISAGEASGDLYGAQLIVALRRRARKEDEPLEFLGVGGESMRAAGCEIVVESRHLAVVGMTEIIGQLPKIYSEFRKLLRAVDQAAQKPNVAIVIDSPAFNFRVARAMHARGIPVTYFVAPQLWAWREYRVKRMQKWIKKVLCIFPFEKAFYRKYKVDAEYVGHPLADLPRPQISREEYAQQNVLDASRTWVALLPGSRRKEVKAHLSQIMEAAALLATDNATYQFLFPVASSLDVAWFQNMMKQVELTRGIPETALASMVPVRNAAPALLHSRAAVVTSGTATVEAALMGVPFIAVYRLSALTFFAAKRLVKVPHVAMPNLIAGRQIIPELLQNDFTPESMVKHLQQIVPDGEPRQQMLAGLAEVQATLHREGERPAVERAADAIMKSL
ncbi:MAG: lipid-A-disaccharide synthase [Acidobacteria bacterium]|nr:MAG: lipid-A-disaccharide synthase [Acidobacteriota bacterium]